MDARADDDDNDNIIRFECPHCGGMCEVRRADIKCRVFRHAVHADSMVPYNPHASRQDLEGANIRGCGKPFALDSDDRPVPCDYR